MSQFNNFKQWIFENLLPAFYQTNDTYKDAEGKGIIQRFIEVCAEYFDNEVQPDIDTAMDNIDFDKAQLIFLNQLWEYFDCIPYAYGVLVNNEKYDPENIQRWFNSALGFPKADPRRILRYAISLFKIRGTSRFYQILGRFYGVEISLESIEVSQGNIDHIEYGPIVLDTLEWLGQPGSLSIPAEGVESAFPTISWHQEYVIYYIDGTTSSGVSTNNGTVVYIPTGKIEGHVNGTTGEISWTEENPSYTTPNPLGTITVAITANDQSLNIDYIVMQSPKTDYIVSSVPIAADLYYSDHDSQNPRSFILLSAENSPVYPVIDVTYQEEWASGGSNLTTTTYEVLPGQLYEDMFDFTDESGREFMDEHGIVSAEANAFARPLAEVKVVLRDYPDITDTFEVWQRSDGDLEFTEVILEYDDIPAKGGTVTPRVTVYGSFDGKAPEDITDRCLWGNWEGSAVDSEGGVSADSRRRVTGERQIIDHVTVYVYAEGKVTTASAYVYQQQNHITYDLVLERIAGYFGDYHLDAGASSKGPDLADAVVEVLEVYTSSDQGSTLSFWFADGDDIEFFFSDDQGWVDEKTGIVSVDEQISTSEDTVIDVVRITQWRLVSPTGEVLINNPNASANVYQRISKIPSITLDHTSDSVTINSATYEGSFTITTNSDCNGVDLVVIPWGTNGSVNGYLSVTINGIAYTQDTQNISLGTSRSYTITYVAYANRGTSQYDMSIYLTPKYNNGSTSYTGDSHEYELELTRN